jgi:hypothetical protein
MKLYAQDLRRPVSAIALVAAAAGLVLTGCGPSSSSSSGSGSPTGPSASSTQSTSTSGGSSSVTTSDSVPFPDTVGDTWTYNSSISDGGTVVNKVASVTSVSAGQQVRMEDTSTIAGARHTTSAYYILHSDGSISLPFSQFSQSSSGVSVKLISGGIIWPSAAVLASGQEHHSTLKIEYVIGGKKETVTSHVTVRGEGAQTVTVPAGTYSTTEVQMTEAEKFEGYNVSVEIRTWLASGVGPVQSEVTDIDGAGSIVKEQLVSFVKG